MALDDEKYILLTTFRRDGTPVATPVWVVGLDGGRLGFWTSSGSGKAKRLAHTERVTVSPCDARGRVRANAGVVDATARLVTGSELEEIRKRVVAKNLDRPTGSRSGKHPPRQKRGQRAFQASEVPPGDCLLPWTPRPAPPILPRIARRDASCR